MSLLASRLLLELQNLIINDLSIGILLLTAASSAFTIDIESLRDSSDGLWVQLSDLLLLLLLMRIAAIEDFLRLSCLIGSLFGDTMTALSEALGGV